MREGRAMDAMAVGCLRLLLLLSLLAALTPLSSAQDAGANGLIGGTDTFNGLATALLRRFRLGPDAYQVVGSSAALDSFNGGGLVVAVSDTPMAATQEVAADSISKLYGRYTIPLYLATYGFFVNAPQGSVFSLTTLQTYTIYSVGGTWNTYGVPEAGPIVRFARGASCGANYILKMYWKLGANAPVPLDDTPLQYPQVVYVTQAADMCKSLTTKPGGIAYSLTGLCMPYVRAGQIVEVQLQQGNGAFIKPSRSVPAAAIPKVLPNAWDSWEAVPAKLMFSKAKLAPPIVVFQYALIRRRGLRITGRPGLVMRNFLLFAANVGPGVLANFGYLPVPPRLKAKNDIAIRAVKLF